VGKETTDHFWGGIGSLYPNKGPHQPLFRTLRRINPMKMKIGIEDRWGKISTICLAGDLDFGTSPKVREEVSSLTKRHTNQIVVDLTDVGYMDSSGLATLINGQQGSKRSNIRFTLMGIGPSLEAVFNLTNVKDIFEIIEGVPLPTIDLIADQAIQQNR
jgi:anti-sigma B factor antagonist